MKKKILSLAVLLLQVPVSYSQKMERHKKFKTEKEDSVEIVKKIDTLKIVEPLIANQPCNFTMRVNK